MNYIAALVTLIITLPSHVNSSSKISPSLTEILKSKSASSSKNIPPHIKKEFQRATKELKASGIEKSALTKGKKVPSFNINKMKFKDFYSKKPVILKFYRGSWCPYCQLEMKAYEDYKKRIEAKGYQLVILTPDTNFEIKRFKRTQKITMPIYQDVNNQIAKKFGIAFRLDPKVAKLYKGFGIDLQKSQGNKKSELPLPGTYIINKEGEITYAFIDVDYTKRLDPKELLKKL